MTKEIRLIKPSQSQFEAFCADPVNIKKLKKLSVTGSIRGVDISDFGSLSKLGNLEELIIEDQISQDNLEQICELRSLKKLQIDHAGKLTELDPLQKLVKLNSLTVTVPTSWRTRYVTLPTLKPLSSLTMLKFLNLAGVSLDRDGLAPLKELTKLRELYVIKKYWEEMDALKNLLPRQ